MNGRGVKVMFACRMDMVVPNALALTGRTFGCPLSILLMLQSLTELHIPQMSKTGSGVELFNSAAILNHVLVTREFHVQVHLAPIPVVKQLR